MARYKDSVCRLCRREGMKLFLKGERCYTDKCAIERRGYPPGQHGRRRIKMLGYGIQLREKQRVKRIYGMMEKQFRNYFGRAERMKGVTGLNLLVLLEQRLDNITYRLGFGASRAQARQLVRHGHILVNGKKVNLPSCLVKKGSEISASEKSKKVKFKQGSQEGLLIAYNMETAASRGVPKWLELDKANFRGTVVDIPNREDIGLTIQENLIVELYSK